MLRNALEETLYWVISALINLILFSLLTTAFLVKVKDTPELYPLRVEIKEIKVKERKEEVRSVVKAKAEASKMTAKKTKESAGKSKLGAGVSSAHEKGDVEVPVQEDVSVLAELQKRIASRVREKEVKKEVGTISAVIRGKEVRIRGGSRKIVYVPPLPSLVASEFPAGVRVRIWVAPDGGVVRALLIQRSGSVNIDSVLLSFVRGIRFERVIEEELQVGEITFRFQGG